MKKSISKTKITVLRVRPLCSFTSKVLQKIDLKAHLRLDIADANREQN